MQSRNTHEVRYGRGAENIPVAAVDGPLVARDQRRHHTGNTHRLRIRAVGRQARGDGVACRLAQALDYIMVVVNRSMEKVRSGGVQRSMREIAASALQDALTVFAEP